MRERTPGDKELLRQIITRPDSVGDEATRFIGELVQDDKTGKVGEALEEVLGMERVDGGKGAFDKRRKLDTGSHQDGIEFKKAA